MGVGLLLVALITMPAEPSGAAVVAAREPVTTIGPAGTAIGIDRAPVGRSITATEPDPTPVSVQTDPPTTEDPAPDPDDPDVHDPVEAARSDRSIGSWLLVAGAFVAAAAGIGTVLAHTREKRR